MRKGAVVVCAFLFALCASFAAAQNNPYPDTLKVDYFQNVNGSIDQTVHITNPGTSGTSLCAAVFVLDVNQEMSECCNCYVSPDGLRTLSVDVDLSSNPLTGTLVPAGAIKIVSTTTTSGTCPTYPLSLHPTPSVRAWATHLQNSGVLTETASQDATLSVAELQRLERECYGIYIVGSGKGVCTCGTGD